QEARRAAGVAVLAARAGDLLEAVRAGRAALDAGVEAGDAVGGGRTRLGRVRARAEHVGGDGPGHVIDEGVGVRSGVLAVRARALADAVGAVGRVGVAARLVGVADLRRLVRADVLQRRGVVGADAQQLADADRVDVAGVHRAHRRRRSAARAFAARPVQLARGLDIDGVERDGAAVAVVLDHLVARVLEAAVADGRRLARAAQHRDRVVADVREPDVLDRAPAEAVNAVADLRPEDHVLDRAAVGDLEDRVGAALTVDRAILQAALHGAHLAVVVGDAHRARDGRRSRGRRPRRHLARRRDHHAAARARRAGGGGRAAAPRGSGRAGGAGRAAAPRGSGRAGGAGRAAAPRGSGRARGAGRRAATGGARATARARAAARPRRSRRGGATRRARGAGRRAAGAPGGARVAARARRAVVAGATRRARAAR